MERNIPSLGTRRITVNADRGTSATASMRQRLDSNVLWAADRVGRALGLLMLGCSDGKDVKFAGTLADCIQMVVVVPEHLSDGIAGQQACVMSDRVSSVEMGTSLVDDKSRLH